MMDNITITAAEANHVSTRKQILDGLQGQFVKINDTIINYSLSAEEVLNLVKAEMEIIRTIFTLRIRHDVPPF